MPNFKLCVVKKNNLTMKDGKLNIIFPEELIKIKDITDSVLDLERLDTLTRGYISSKYAISDFINKGLVDCNPDACVLAIVYNKDHGISVLEPLYKELYHTKQEKTVYEQINEFAHDMEEALIYCFPYIKNSNIYYDKVAYCFKNYKWLTKPDVLKFLRESFTKGKQFSDVEITEQMEEQAKTDKQMKFYIDKIKNDRVYLSFMDNFLNNALDEKGNLKEDVGLMLKEYYDALMVGFYRTFETTTGRFNYFKFREFYREYYNHFIGPKLIIPDELQQKLDSLSTIAINNTAKPQPVQQPVQPQPAKSPVAFRIQKPDYSYASSNGLSKMTIEEAHQLRDEYFPDEHKNDATIAYNPDGTFVTNDDEEYRHIK